MKALLVFILFVIGLARAEEFDSFCSRPNGMYNVPHPTDCTKLISCIGTNATVLTCPDDKWFDEILVICRPKDVAQCSKEFNAFCKSSTGYYNVPHPTDCTQFIMCIGSNATVLSCLDDKWFDDYHMLCLPRDTAKCSAEFNSFCTSPNTSCYVVPHPLDCAKFIQCSGSIATVIPCVNGYWFDEIALICRPKDVAKCSGEFNALCTTTGIYIVPHPSECTKYIQCTGNVATVHTCPDDKWFDDYLLICRPKCRC